MHKAHGPLIGLGRPVVFMKGCSGANMSVCVCESWGTFWEKPTLAGLNPAKEKGVKTSFATKSFLAWRVASPTEVQTHSL